MKNSGIVIGLLVLLVVSVGFLFYLLTLGTAMSLPLLLLLWLLVFGIFALIGAIAWLAGWLPRKKKTVTPVPPVPEPTVIEPPKAEPVHVMEESRPQGAVIETPMPSEPEPAVIEAPKVPEPETAVIETPKAEPALVAEKEIETKPRPARKARARGFKIVDIVDIEGIGPVYAKKLNSIDINTTLDLLEAGATPLGRKELEEKTGISHELVLEWVNIADLLRIKGVGEEYSDLLEEAGVDTVVELSRRIPEHLHVKMLEINEKKKLVRRPPSLKDVEQWIEEAKVLPRKIEY